MFRTVADPTDFVLETVIGFESRVDAAIENFLDFEFEVAIDLYRRRRNVDAVGNGVRGVGFE